MYIFKKEIYYLINRLLNINSVFLHSWTSVSDAIVCDTWGYREENEVRLEVKEGGDEVESEIKVSARVRKCG